MFTSDEHGRTVNKKKSKSKRSTVVTLEESLWRVVSVYVRLRDTDQYGYGYCCTCGKRLRWNVGAHAGHFMSRTYKATKYDLRNVNLQCVRCNKFMGGMQYEHSLFIDKKHGAGTAAELHRLSKEPTEYEPDDLRRNIVAYKAAVRKMMGRKSF